MALLVGVVVLTQQKRLHTTSTLFFSLVACGFAPPRPSRVIVAPGTRSHTQTHTRTGWYAHKSLIETHTHTHMPNTKPSCCWWLFCVISEPPPEPCPSDVSPAAVLWGVCFCLCMGMCMCVCMYVGAGGRRHTYCFESARHDTN